MRYKKAIVRSPSDSYSKCISSHPDQNKMDLHLARYQHKKYCTTLTELGIEVIQLPSEKNFPDSCFIEDNAIIHEDRAFISLMSVSSRKGEEESLIGILSHYKKVKKATFPATIEGGDVLHLPNRLIAGITQRTNDEGIRQMKDWLKIKTDSCLNLTIVHLKSYMTYLDNDIIVVTKQFANHPVINNLKTLIIPETEEYAANTLTINGTILLPKGYPKITQMIKEEGFETITVDVSEFQKCEGALTCLSLLF